MSERGRHARDLHRKGPARFREAGIDGEVIVADNGSTDGSPDIAAALGARVVTVAARATATRSWAASRRRADATSSWATPTTATTSSKSRSSSRSFARARAGSRLPPAMRRRPRQARARCRLAPLVGQSHVFVPGSPVVPRADPRRVLRHARLHARAVPPARPALHRDGIRHRDDHQGSLYR